MTEKDLELLLGGKEAAPRRQNVSVVLSPDITRNSMRLKKLRRDRMQALLCALAALIFLLAAAGMALYLKNAGNLETAGRTILLIAAGGMGLTLLMAPALAWFSDEEKMNEA